MLAQRLDLGGAEALHLGDGGREGRLQGGLRVDLDVAKRNERSLFHNHPEAHIEDTLPLRISETE